MASFRKKRRHRFRTFLAVMIVLGLIVFLALWQRLTVSRYTVTLDDLPDEFNGFRIVQVTDLHCARFGDHQEELCQKIESLEPDILVLTGDMMDQNILDPEPTRELCEYFADKVPMYAVTGNHDQWIGTVDLTKLRQVYEDCGVTLLRHETVEIERNGQIICLSGEDDPAHWGNDTVGYLQENPLTVEPAEDSVNILLYHRANAFPALRELGFDLIISGHMHGGQVRIPFAGGLVSPTREYFPDYTGGKYSENGTVMIVGRGLGNAISIPRIFNPPEVVLITLKQK